MSIKEHLIAKRAGSLRNLCFTVPDFCGILPENVPPDRERTHHLGHICSIKFADSVSWSTDFYWTPMMHTHFRVWECGRGKEGKTHPIQLQFGGGSLGGGCTKMKWLNEVIDRAIRLTFVRFLLNTSWTLVISLLWFSVIFSFSLPSRIDQPFFPALLNILEFVRHRFAKWRAFAFVTRCSYFSNSNQ